MKKTKIKKRALSLLLSLALFLSFLPVMPFFSSADTDTRVTDASTMNDWTEFFGPDVLNTVNAGGVWGDKSVFTNADAFASYGIFMTDKDKNFLVALSAIASNKSIVGYSALPTDTVMVLDLSNSMSASSLADMVEATNAAIRELLALNRNNRVSVIVYAGTRVSSGGGPGGGGNSNRFGLEESATVLLPLDRYEGVIRNGQESFLSYSRNNDTVSVINGVLDLGYGERNPSKAASGATYIQAGIQLAWDQFEAVTDTVITEGPQKGTVRMPVLVLMSDGAPTAATTSFTNVGNSTHGDGGSISTTNSFLTQLSAVWVRTQMEEKYGRSSLLYTLGLDVENNDTARAVLNPDVNTEALTNHWNNYLAASGSVYSSGFSVSVNSDVKNFFKAEDGSYAFKSYVTDYFQASSNSSAGNELVGAFDKIVDQIIIQSKYYPTLVESGNHNLDGYVTFTDELGEYMEVKDIKGLTVAGTLYKGSALAQSVVDGTMFGDISSGNPSQLTTAGREMVKAIMRRIGCSEDDAMTLAKNAINDGQIFYESDSNYSNYIGWYADENGNYLGYWNGGEIDPSVGATYVNKSYGFVGTVGSDQEYNKTDMLYVSVQVHKHIKSGHEQILYRIPASLVPMVEYKIEFDGTDLETGTNFKLNVGGATEPLRLIYELGLRSDINPININDKIDTTYKFKDSKGYTFYTNSWGTHAHSEASSPDTHDATTFEFEPSLENERYYYTSNTPIYDADGNAVTYDPKTVAGTYYLKYVTFKTTGSDSEAQMVENMVEISAENLALSVYDTTFGEWVIPKGTPFRRIADPAGTEYAQKKGTNVTETLEYSNYPMLIHPAGEIDYTIAACLGNNGRFSVAPAQGISLTKTMEYPELGRNETFTFEITLTGSGLPSEYPIYNYDGELLSTATLASGNKLTVQVKTGETVYVTGIPTGTQYSVVEVLPVGSPWKVNASDGANGTVALYTFQNVSFENTPTTYGSLLINKTVNHPFGDSYAMPEKVFDITVNFSGVADGSVVTVDGVDTTVSGGKLDLKIQHGQTIVINNLPSDTTYTVTEKAYDGFTLSGSGLTGIISDDKNAEALLVNTYAPASAELNVSHVGVKYLDGREWLDGDTFVFSLQYFNGVNWVPVSSETRTVSKNTAAHSFTFDSLLEAFDFNKIGTYQFRVLESYVDIGGLVCDTSEKTFSITVVDDAFSGTLKISDVTTSTPNSYNTKSGTVVTRDTVTGNWTVTTNFNNVYSVLGTAVVSVNVTKNIVNNTGVPFGKDGFTFNIYEIHGTTEIYVGTTVATDVNGETVFVFDIDANRLGETITYKIVEVNDGKQGVHYDASEKTFTVQLVDNLNGTVRAQVNGADTNEYATSFTNTYSLLPADIEISGVKNLAGRDLVNGEFVFELYRTDSTFAINASPVDTQYNNGNSFTLSDTLSVAGTYYYVVKEAVSSLPHVTSDTAEYHITVEVSKGTGASLKAEITSVTKGGAAVSASDIVFNNTYTPDATHLAIFGAKTMTGRTPKNGEFWFLLFDGSNQIGRVSNNANGNFIFDEIEFTSAGTYVYTVKEDLSDKKSYIGYDDSVFTVTVVVTDDGAGNLSKTVTYSKGGQAVSGIVFENEYKPDSVSVTFEGLKTMTGRNPRDKEFTFALADSEGNPLESVQNGADGKFAFSTLTFDKAGTYYYTVSETADNTKGYIHYDSYRVFITVTVTDNEYGVLTAAVSYEKGASSASGINFVNHYNPDPVFVTLSGNKTMAIRNPKAGEFSFLLVDSVGNVVDTVSNRADGTFTFKALELDAKGTYTYTVKEDLSDKKSYIVYDETVYTVVITVTDDGDGNLSYSVAYKKGAEDAAGIAFANRYNPTAATVTLNGLKTMTVRDPKNKEFTFNLIDSVGQTVATAQNAADGTFVFDALTFPATGVYTYTVKEDLTSKKGYIVYDESVYTVTVTVTDDTVGALSASVSYAHNGTSVSSITFRNAYNPADTYVTLSGVKTLEGRQLKADEFTFALIDAQGKQLGSVKNDANGNFSFAPILYTSAGVYYYTVKEDTSANLKNVDYDTNVYTVAVTVTDNSEGVLSASVAYLKSGSSATEISFKNTYNPDSVFVTLQGQKELTFRNPKADEFTFILSDSNGDAIDTVKNLADGSFTFEGIELNAKGTYTYTVKEDLTDKKAYIGYDDSVITVTVTVTDDDNDGVLSYDVSYAKGSAAVGAISFKNTYNPTAATVTLNGLKTMTVRNPKDKEFTFNLLNAEGKVVESVSNGADGKFSFGTLTFTETGTYTYTVAEDLSDKKSYIVYDEIPVTVTVVVTDDTLGTLSAAVSYKKGSEVATGITFNNIYDPADATASVVGLKTLEGRKLKEGEFIFHLVDSTGTIVDTQKNGADGKFAFKALTFTAAGEYIYTVIEDATNKLDNVTYDENTYTVTVTVTDQGGALAATLSYKAKNPNNAENATFINVFTPVPVDVAFSVKKNIKNDTPKVIGLNGYEFKLAGDGLTAPLTVKSGTDGTASFDAITYTSADIGKTFNYTITEVKGDVDNMVYDETEVKVSVEITVTEDGVIVPVIKQDGKAVDKVEASFINVYVPASVTTFFSVKKILTNNTDEVIGLDGFEFKLVGDGLTVPLTVKSDANGNAVFSAVTYTAEDIGKTFNYTVTEVKGSVEYMDYDTSEVKISVTVTVNADGVIVPVIQVNGAAVEAAVATFTNLYHGNPDTSDYGLQMWMLLALVGSGLTAGALLLKRRLSEQE